MALETKKSPAKSLAPADGSPLLSLPFDQYERYAMTQVIADVIRSSLKRQRLMVLDVGGAPGSLRRFLPDDDVFIVDVERMHCPGYLLADGRALPFKDQVFDVVTCHDTLEHVPAGQREAFLLELFRVTADFAVINGPFNDPLTEKAERLVVENIRDTVGENHPHFCFLQQHHDLGLPSLNGALSLIKRLGLAKTVIPNGPLFDWLTRMTVKHYLSALTPEGIRPAEYDLWCNESYVPCRSEGPTYRQAVVVSKRDDRPILKRIANRLRADQGHQVANDNISLLASVVASALGPYSTLVREGLNNKDERIANIEDALAQTQAALVGRDQHIANIEDAMAQTQAALADRDQHIANIEYAMTGGRRRGLLSLFRRGLRAILWKR